VSVSVPALSPAVARGLADLDEAVLVDLRAPVAFASGHPPGALSVPFSPRGLAQRVHVALPSASPATVLVAPDDATAEHAAAQLAAAGITVRGALEGGFAAWQAAGFPETSLAEVGLEELSRRSRHDTIVDVREPLEWTTGHVPGALLIPLGTLRHQLASIPRGGRLVTICEAGVRSCTAASVLLSAGFTEIAHVPAGSSGYRKSGLPLQFPAERTAVR
jgi:hydroxyacylglutathione hydrolase